MPCNITQRELAAQVGEAVTAAGGVPLEFNTIAVSDNQSQATPGMRASLVSREVIADSIELMVHAHDFDARRLPGGLRQDDAGRADGARAAWTSPPSCSTAARCAPGGSATAR